MSSNFEQLQALLKQKKAALKGAGRTITPKPGKTTYVLLPPWRKNDPTFWHDFGQHYIKDESGKAQAVYICTHDTFGTPCAVCDGLSEAQRTIGVSNPAAAKMIKEARSAQKYLIGVLALDSDNPDEPQVLAVGKKAFDQILSTTIEWGQQLFDPTNPQILQIERTGTSQLDTVYTVTITPRKHTFKKPVQPINLDEFVQQENEEAKKKTLLTMNSLFSRVAKGAPALAAPANSVAADKFEDVPNTFTASANNSALNLSTDIDALMADLAPTN